MNEWEEVIKKEAEKERAFNERLDRIGYGLERLAAAIETHNQLKRIEKN